MRQDKAKAHEKQEARRDAAREKFPSAVSSRCWRHIAEELEIPAKVVDRHRDQRNSARNVDAPKANPGRGCGILVGDVRHGSFRLDSNVRRFSIPGKSLTQPFATL